MPIIWASSCGFSFVGTNVVYVADDRPLASGGGGQERPRERNAWPDGAGQRVVRQRLCHRGGNVREHPRDVRGRRYEPESHRRDAGDRRTQKWQLAGPYWQLITTFNTGFRGIALAPVK